MAISIFNDVIGPVMRGHGSLPTTHQGQGSDMGLFGGLLGWDAADERLPLSPTSFPFAPALSREVVSMPRTTWARSRVAALLLAVLTIPAGAMAPSLISDPYRVDVVHSVCRVEFSDITDRICGDAAERVRFRADSDSYPKDYRVDVVHYVFRVELSDTTDRIRGDAAVRIRFRADGVQRLRLDLVGPTTSSVGAKGMTVREVRSGGAALPFRHAGDVLWIDLPEPSHTDSTIEVRVVYDGVPASGLMVGPNRHGERAFFSDDWPNLARNWLPTVDHPYDKASTEMVVTAPAHYQVVSNGLLVGQTDLPGGMRRTHWSESVPIPTWEVVIAASPFAVAYHEPWRGLPLETWVFPQDRGTGFGVYEATTRLAMDFFSDYIGPYAYEKVANVQSSSTSGGMEAAGAIFYGAESATGVHPERWRHVIVHELAHQWFGNAVTEGDFDDVWLSEGFAEYFTLLYREHVDGRDSFVQGLRNARDLARTFYATNPDYTVVHNNLTDMSKVTVYGGTYEKGAWVLHMLRHKVGDTAFHDGIRSYYRRYMNGNARVADFRRAMEEASGQDLKPFFDQWLRRGGWPKVTGRWSWNAARGTVDVEVRQEVSGSGGFMDLPVEVGIRLPGQVSPEVRGVIHLQGERATASFPVANRPLAVTLDPNEWLIADTHLEETGGR